MAGQPTKYKPEYVEQVEKACAAFGATDKGLSDYFSVSVQAINDWKKAHSEFHEAMLRGKESFDVKEVEASLLKRALGFEYTEKSTEAIIDKDGVISTLKTVKNTVKYYPPDVGACFGWLYNRNPERWKQRKAVEVTGPGGGPLNITGKPDLMKLSVAELKQLKELMEKADAGI